MKRNAGAILLIFGIFALIVALNFIFFVDTTAAEEDETTGDRSSYLARPYGTLAYYTLLEESGYTVTRFEKPFTELEPNNPSTLVVIAPPESYNPNAEELASLTAWVEAGGLLVIIDREIYGIRFGDTTVYTQRAYSNAYAHPTSESVYTQDVKRVALSDHATRIKLSGPNFTSHIGDSYGAVLSDLRVGSGRVVFLTDPFIVANNGIRQTDNARLAVNLFVERPEGPIAFDEYHHGRGVRTTRGGLLSYFRGTPLPWMVWQGALIALFAIFTFGRRFARPLPVKRESRTTNLEFVSSMANITRLARASDLAMQNIYSEFRKRVARLTGLPVTTPAARLAAPLARRVNMDEQEMAGILTVCEQAAQGREVGDAELLKLVTRIREIESRLGI
jgi:hypothetical protein